MGMMGSAMGGMSSNFMSIATANRRASDERDKYKNQAALARYNRDVAENQRIAELQNAKAAEAQAGRKKSQLHSSNQMLREKQLAIMAKSGVTMAGTPLLLAQDQITEMTLAENDIIYGGDIQAREHRVKASYFESVANMAEYHAKVAETMGKFRSETIMAQKKMTIGKMFWDGANVTSFAQIDDPKQFKQFDTSTLSNMGSGGGSKEASTDSSFSFMRENKSSDPSRRNASGGYGTSSSGSAMIINK